MEVTKKEIRAENKEVKRPKIDSAIIELLTLTGESELDIRSSDGTVIFSLERENC
jgi:hypothetical protein